MKTFETCMTESTCQKRVTVCELYSDDDVLLSRESNRCSPDGGTCSRLGIKSVKDTYPSSSNCHWEHAEVRALERLMIGDRMRVAKAIIYGHDFPCPDCERRLRGAGVTTIECVPEKAGLRV